MRVLAIGCHPDDIEIGCGGTLAKYAKLGHEVFSCHVANGNMGHAIIMPDELRRIRTKEAEEAGAVLGVKEVFNIDVNDLEVDSTNMETVKKVVDLIRYVRPDVIITHGPDDYMTDHVETGKISDGEPMEKQLNDKQKKILELINRQVKERGYPPSVREICRELRYKSTSTVHAHLKKLEDEGLLQKAPGTPRGLKVVGSQVQDTDKPTVRTVEIPVIGKVTAGKPILAVENVEEYFPVPEELTDSSTLFMLKVSGESMIEAGIFDGDLVIVKQQSTALNGDKIVALINQEATVKTFYKEKDRIRLQPENKYMDPIYVDPSDSFAILGKVIGLFRRM
jgi:repressor LexA